MKLAVIFPGIGYHTDKPLLYYGKKLAEKNGYDIKEVSYSNFPENIKGSEEKMKKALLTAAQQAEEMLRETDFSKYDTLLFISKSIGTAAASIYAKNHLLDTNNIFYTPVEGSFDFMEQKGIVFHGTKDPWVETSIVKNACRDKQLPLYITENANHSLETGDVLTDLRNLENIMKQVNEYMGTI